jgi:zinc protease
VAIALAALALFANASVASARHHHRRYTVRPAVAPARVSDAAAAWPELKGPLPPDPSTTFGVLSNGMRFAVRHNDTPSKSVSFRLRISAGSLDEGAGEAGYSHFIEHMSFRGSTHVPDGGALRALENLGVSLEADADAFTTPSETFYTFNVPSNDPATLETVLMLLRETASEVLFDDQAVSSERQVILAEERQRDSGSLHVLKTSQKLVFGDLGPALTPIGNDATILSASGSSLRAFYRSHYQPRNATLIVVGDIDVGDIQRRLRSHFEDWKSQAPPPSARVAPGLPGDGLRLATLIEPSATTTVLYNWPHTAITGTGDLAREHTDIATVIGMSALNERLDRQARGWNAPFISAQAVRSSASGLADLYQLNVTYGLDGPIPAIEAAQATLSTLLKSGVSDSEFARAMDTLHSRFASLADGEKTMSSSALANEILACVDAGIAFHAPIQAADLFNRVAPGLKVEDVTEALRAAFSGTGPLVVVAAQLPVAGGEPAILAALAATPGSPPEIASSTPKPVVAAWPYTSFGPPGKVVARSRIDDLGTTLVTFDNGTRAAIKPTPFQAGETYVDLQFGRGRLGFPKDRAVPAWALPETFVIGGLGQLGTDDLRQLFDDRAAALRFAVTDDSFRLVGRTRPEDLVSELQFLTAFISDPGWRPEGLDAARSAELARLGTASSSPDGVLARSSALIAHDYDPRWRAPQFADIRSVRLNDVRELLQRALATSQVDAAIVGDVDVDHAIAALSTTLGALPPRESEASQDPGDERLFPPRAQPLLLRHNGGPDQGAAAVVWPTQGIYPDHKIQRDLTVLRMVLLHRLFDELRTHAGLTYMPQSSTEASFATPGFGTIEIEADVPPEKTANFFDVVALVVADLKASPVSADELARVREPYVGDVVREQQSNEYWITMLSGIQRDPSRPDLIRSTVPDLKSVSPDDVLKAARTYLRDDMLWKIVVLPKDYVLKPGEPGG